MKGWVARELWLQVLLLDKQELIPLILSAHPVFNPRVRETERGPD